MKNVINRIGVNTTEFIKVETTKEYDVIITTLFKEGDDSINPKTKMYEYKVNAIDEYKAKALAKCLFWSLHNSSIWECYIL